jgi:hypothetical protein
MRSSSSLSSPVLQLPFRAVPGDDAMMGARRDQQRDRPGQQAERQDGRELRALRQGIEHCLERRLQLEPEQYLHAEDRHAVLVQGDLGLLSRRHVWPPGSPGRSRRLRLPVTFLLMVTGTLPLYPERPLR